MDRRLNIAVPFNYDEGWMGGNYYVLNLISSLNCLPSAEQPNIYLLTHDESSLAFIRDGANYARLQRLNPKRLKNVDGARLKKRRWYKRLKLGFLKKEYTFDAVFPYPLDSRHRHTAVWIPDFQERHLQGFFNEAQLLQRERQHRYYIEHFDHIVFSSEAARSDFHRFYPEAGNATYVVHFAVFPKPAKSADLEGVLRKHGLGTKYFFCPNQLWVHKNHVTVIEAVALAASHGANVAMVFSGTEHDHRAPGHSQMLRELAERRGVSDRIRFLGFQPREEQMLLFKHALAIVQPSLFEGWSTVIEEAKAFSQYVIASDLPVNREQIQRNVEFFSPTSASELAAILSRVAQTSPIRETIDYSQAQYAFARDFIDMIRIVALQGKGLAGLA